MWEDLEILLFGQFWPVFFFLSEHVVTDFPSAALLIFYLATMIVAPGNVCYVLQSLLDSEIRLHI
jgi:hypothetical protein